MIKDWYSIKIVFFFQFSAPIIIAGYDDPFSDDDESRSDQRTDPSERQGGEEEEQEEEEEEEEEEQDQEEEEEEEEEDGLVDIDDLERRIAEMERRRRQEAERYGCLSISLVRASAGQYLRQYEGILDDDVRENLDYPYVYQNLLHNSISRFYRDLIRRDGTHIRVWVQFGVRFSRNSIDGRQEIDVPM